MSAIQELSSDQKRVIDLIFEVFWEEAIWPTFQYADKLLAREGIDLQRALRSMPKRLVFPDVTWGGWFYRPEDELKLTVAGLHLCQRASREVRYFIDALRYMAQREWDDVPPRPNEVSDLEITSADVMKAIGGDKSDLARTHLLLSVEPSIYSVLSGQGSEWSLRPSIEIRRFREVRDVEDYLEIQTRFLVPSLEKGPEVEPGHRPQVDRIKERSRFIGSLLRHPIISGLVSGLALALILAVLNLK